MTDINTGGAAFPCEGGSDSGLFADPGMTLRDYFATTVDKDEYGDLVYRHLSEKAKGILAGYSRPSEPGNDLRAQWMIDCIKWEMAWRSALRFMMADAMLAAREVQP